MRVIPNTTISDANFSRASSATYVNVAGVLSTASSNVPRVQYDPVTHDIVGFLLESSATNLNTYSEDLNNAAYTLTASSYTSNAVNGPSGTLTADKLVENSATAEHYYTRTTAYTITANTTNVFSLFVKALTRTKLRVRMYDNATGNNYIYYDFDLNTATVSTNTNGGAASNHSAGITDYGSGWYRIHVSGLIDASSTAINIRVSLMNGASISYLGDGSSGLHVWGHQFESGQTPTSYIATTSASVTRAADVVSGGIFGSSSVAEPYAGETAWVSGATYAIGDVRILTETHRKYTRLTAGAGTTPPNLDATNWADSGPTNRWAMLDLNRSVQTSDTGPLVFVFSPGKRVDSFALVGLVSTSVRLQVLTPTGTVLDTTINTLDRNTTTWTEYLVGGFKYKATVIQFNLPIVSNTTFVVTINGSTVKCAGLVCGSSIYLGKPQYQAVNNAVNYSKIDRDAYGVATLTQRRTVPKVDVKLECAKATVDSLRQARSDLNAVVALWSGLDDEVDDGYFESLLILGIYREFSISIDYPDFAMTTLQIEEV